MKLYLDDDIASARLLQMLCSADHDAQIPADAGLRGEPDAVHLTHAIQESRVFLSRNYRDFEVLHLHLMQAQGRHSGILVVRRDKNTQRNMMPHDIVRAIRNLEAAGMPHSDQYIILNAWQ
jgi:hypothetical protein